MMVPVKCPNCEYVSDYIPPARIHPGQSYATACELCGRIIYGTLPLSEVFSKSEENYSVSNSPSSVHPEVEYSGAGTR
jgi:hypothetical protein